MMQEKVVRKKFQVFISSTSDDLKEERKIAIEAILDAGHIPAGMEIFKGGGEKWETIQKWIDDSDIYVLILGGRYGSTDKQTNLSYTQLEYEYAQMKKIPMFSIVLSDSLLERKAKEIGEENVYEKGNVELYKRFKSTVLTPTAKIVDWKEQIATTIHSHLNSIINDPAYRLIGWARADSNINNFHALSDEDADNAFEMIFNEVLSRRYPVDIDELSKINSRNWLERLNINGLLDSFRRRIELEPMKTDSNMIKVTITNIIKYQYLRDGYQQFGISFKATKQQANSFKIEQLLIDEDNFTDQMECIIEKESNRGQFMYKVSSKSAMPIKQLPCNIYYKCSYICPALDFYQSHRLVFPCEDFYVTVVLKNMDERFSVVASTFSALSTTQSDDFKASELRNYGDCDLSLPKWSMPGAGYVVTLKNKSENNHA